MKQSINPKAFGVFVGLYNKLNDTNLSVKQAATIDSLVKTFNASQQFLKEAHTNVVSKQFDCGVPDSGSTKFKSYSLLDMPNVDKKVYDIIVKNPGLSRYEITGRLSNRLSTICGAVNRLTNNGFVRATGTKIDEETQRQVETLATV